MRLTTAIVPLAVTRTGGLRTQSTLVQLHEGRLTKCTSVHSYRPGTQSTLAYRPVSLKHGRRILLFTEQRTRETATAFDRAQRRRSSAP